MKLGRVRRSFVSDEQKEQLKRDLSRSPEEFGYNIANWSGTLLHKHLKVHYQVTYKQAAVYVLLHELGFSFQRARGKYPERDETMRESAEVDKKTSDVAMKIKVLLSCLRMSSH